MLEDALFRAMCDETSDAVFVKDVAGRYLYVNRACAALVGVAPDQIVGTDDEAWFGAPAAAEIRALDAAVRDGARPRTSEEERLLGGQRHVFATTRSPFRDQAGRVLGIVGVAREVTAARDAARAIQAERDAYARIAATAPGALASFRVHPDGRVACPFASEAVREVLGIEPATLREQPGFVRDRTHPDDVARVADALAASARELTGLHVEHRYAHPQRGEIWLEIRSTPERAPDGTTTWHGFLIDITARKQVEQALRDERNRLAGIAATSPGALYTFRRRPDGSYVMPYVSEAMQDLYGASPPELMADAELAFRRIEPDDLPRVMASIDASARTMTPWRCEYRIQHPTRGLIWADGHSTPLREPDGAITWSGVLLDVTARKQAEEVVRAERDRFEAIAATSPGLIYTCELDHDARFVFPYLSPACEDIYGLTAEELQARPERAFEIVHPDDLPGLMASSTETVTTLAPWRHEFRIRHPRKGEIWVQGHTRPMRLPDGRTRWHGFLTEITAQKRASEQLRASEARLRSVVETAPDVLLTVDRDLAIQFINRIAPGQTVAGLIGKNALDCVLPSSRTVAEASIREVLATGAPREYEVEVAAGPDGRPSWAHTRVGPIIEDGTIVGATLCASDISTRREVQLALAASEHRYRTLVDLLPDAVFVKTRGVVTFCNAAFVRMMHAGNADQLVGKRVTELFHPDDHAGLQARIARMRTAGAALEPADETLVALDGFLRPVRVVATPITGDELLFVLHDLTENQRAERLLRSVLESVTDAILTIDERGRILSCNPATSRLFGHAPDALLGQSIALLMPEEIAREHGRYLTSALAPGQPRVVGERREVLALRKDGSTFPIELTVSAFRLGGARHFTGVIRDVTARRRLEEQFRQAHKMEAFGQLAGGVAHDFNNILTIILGATEVLAQAFHEPASAAPGEVDVTLADIDDAGQRAAALTRQLLAFSRKTVLEPKVLDLNAIVRETEKMLRRLIGEDIRLTTRLAPGLDHVNVDPGQLTQVLLNLAVNARDAMPRGGNLELETAPVRLTEAEAQAHGNLAAGAYVKLTVRDSGVGMSPEVRARIFQPFFTTKGVGKGTGLGLAVVHGVVTQSGGAIVVTSEEGHGASFEILLPAVTVPRVRPDGNRTVRPVETRASVLLVEDDESVRKLAHRALTASGFQVQVAPDGASALALFRAAATPFDLIVTDVVMPTMDGRALGEQVRTLAPQVRILYVSGYTDDMLVRRGLLASEVDFLAKPYTPASLVQAAVRALHRDAPAGTTGSQGGPDRVS